MAVGTFEPATSFPDSPIRKCKTAPLLNRGSKFLGVWRETVPKRGRSGFTQYNESFFCQIQPFAAPMKDAPAPLQLSPSKRRNVITFGVDLNALIVGEFTVL